VPAPLTIDDVSVIIPTHGRRELAQRTLESLGRTAGAEQLEVVVIDDGNDPPLRPETEDLPFPVTLLRHETPLGLNAGRTAGVERTSRPLLAFLDDDVLVCEGWAEGVVAAFADPAVSVVAGRTVADPDGTLPGWIHPRKLLYLSVLDLGDGAAPGPLPGWATPVGANLAVRRSALVHAGGFRPGLDRHGRSLLSGGDTDLVRRITADGGVVRYAPQAAVRHHIDAERLTRSWFRRRARAQGRSDVLMAHARRPGRAALLTEAVRPLRAAGIAAKRLARRESLVDAELWLWSCRGRWDALRDLER